MEIFPIGRVPDCVVCGELAWVLFHVWERDCARLFPIETELSNVIASRVR